LLVSRTPLCQIGMLQVSGRKRETMGFIALLLASIGTAST